MVLHAKIWNIENDENVSRNFTCKYQMSTQRRIWTWNYLSFTWYLSKFVNFWVIKFVWYIFIKLHHNFNVNRKHCSFATVLVTLQTFDVMAQHPNLIFKRIAPLSIFPKSETLICILFSAETSRWCKKRRISTANYKTCTFEWIISSAHHTITSQKRAFINISFL